MCSNALNMLNRKLSTLRPTVCNKIVIGKFNDEPSSEICIIIVCSCAKNLLWCVKKLILTSSLLSCFSETFLCQKWKQNLHFILWFFVDSQNTWQKPNPCGQNVIWNLNQNGIKYLDAILFSLHKVKVNQV